jgi:hypothetical protein
MVMPAIVKELSTTQSILAIADGKEGLGHAFRRKPKLATSTRGTSAEYSVAFFDMATCTSWQSTASQELVLSQLYLYSSHGTGIELGAYR